ncbi:unnamed protein product [Rotaria magnacalcarata]|uniref:GRIP domain-containing protein n=1 Tax=Rotaria magnacalcarata TaxID=392030 RepID=A0A814KK11_9BILA|nr:unnamed protein product [Rotaria magnacalcarata]CAF3758560.1 unnamed protein product [Rotaria magnacalcarata]
MFKNLKEKLANQATKTNLNFIPGISSPDSASISRDSDTRTSSITSREDNHENNRTRLDSAASDISQLSVGHNPNTSLNYVSPPRTYYPPSDIESEYGGGDDSDHESHTKIIQMKKILAIYKNKFSQLKHAYDEVEREKEYIKNILQQHQDTSIKRLSELREQIKLDRQAKEQLECLHQKEIRKREYRIEELTLKLNAQQDLIQLPHDVDQQDIQKLREKNSKLESLLSRCNEAMKTNEAKRIEIEKQRDDLNQRLNEKQNVIESMMKDRHSDDISTASLEVQEHFDSDISVLLQDKQRLQENLEAVHLCVRQLENELDSTKQKLKSTDEEFNEKYESLLVKFNEKSDYMQQLVNDKTKLETSNEELQQQIQTLQEDVNQHSDLNLIVSNQQMNIADLTDEVNKLRETINNVDTILPSSQSTDLYEKIQEIINDRQNLSQEIQNDKQQIEQFENEIQKLKETLSNEKEQHFKNIDTLKHEYEERINQLQKSTDDEINQLKFCLTKIQQDYDESTTNVIQLKDTIESQRQEHFEQIASLNREKQNEFDTNIQQLQEDNKHLKAQLEVLEKLKDSSVQSLQDEHRKSIEILTTQFDDTYKERLSTVEDELKTTIAKQTDQINELNSQIDRLEQLSNEQNVKLDQVESEYKQKLSYIEPLEKDLRNLQLSQHEEFNSTTKQLQDNLQQLAELQAKNNQLEKELNDKQNEFDNHQATTKEINKKIKIRFTENEKEISRLNNIIDEIKTNSEFSTEQLEDKQHKVTQLSATINQLEETNQKLNSKYEKLLEDNQNEINALKATNKASNDKIEEKQNEIVQLNSTIDKMKEIDESITAEYENVSKQLVEKQTQITILADELTQKNSKLIEDLERIKKEFDDKSNEVIHLTNTISELQSENTDINKLQSTTTEECEKLKLQLSEKENEIIHLNHVIDEIKAAEENFKAQLDEKRNKITHLTTVTNELTQKTSSLTDDLESIKKEFDDKSSEVIHLTDIISELQSKNTEMNNLQSAANEEYDKLKNQFTEKENEILRLTNIIDEMTRKAAVLTDDLERTKNKLEDKQNTINQLEENNQSLNNKCEKLLEDKDTEVVRLTSLNSQIKESNELTVEEHAKLKNQVEEKHNEILRLTILIEEMKAQNLSSIEQQELVRKLLEEKQNEIVQLRANIDEIQTTTADQSEQLKQTIEILKESQIIDQQLIEQANKEIETLKQNLSDEQSNSVSLKHAQESHIERLTIEHEQLIGNLKFEYVSMINEKIEEIDNLHQQISFQRSRSDSHQDTIEQLRKELHEYDKTVSQQNAQLDHLLDEQKQRTESITRLKNVLNVDATDHDDLLEQLIHKMEQYQLLISESERLNLDLTKQKSEQSNLHNELQQLEQQFDDMKDELNRNKQELAENKQKYGNQLNQLKQAYETLQKDKHSLEVQFENIQTQFTEKTNQCDELEAKFKKTFIEKDEQILKYQQDFNQLQTLNEDLRLESNDLHDEVKSKANEILSLQANVDRIQQILQSKVDQIEQLSQDKTSLAEDNSQKEKLVSEHKHFIEIHAILEEKFNHLLSEKAGLENQLDTIRIQMQTTESNANQAKQEVTNKLQQAEKRIQEIQIEHDSLQSERNSLQNQIVSLRTTNEENTRRIAEFDGQKSIFEEETIEKDRQITERDEQIQELQSTLTQTQENGTKLRKALHKMKETLTNNDQTRAQESEIRLHILTEEYEQKLKEQQEEYSTSLKSITKELNSQIEEKEQQFNRQRQELINKSYQNEDNIKQKIIEAEQRATAAEEQLQAKQADPSLVQELESQIINLQQQLESLSNREADSIPTTDFAAQTSIEDPRLIPSHASSNDSLHTFMFEPTEIDYLKQIVFAYMTGTDRMTMIKVICALLRYTDDEKSLIIDHEKLRQSRWLKTSR